MGRSVVLLGQETPSARGVLETHAARLRRRGSVDEVRVATLDKDGEDMQATLQTLDADEVYVVPMCLAHTNETTTGVPATLARTSRQVRYCQPVGQDPRITAAIKDRARSAVTPGPETTLVLVGLGNSGADHHRDVLAAHARRLRDRTAFGAIRDCYLVQNPAVECVRYNVPTDDAVAVPAFVLPGPATAERIPEKLELDRGGMAYAGALGRHEQVTAAIESTLDARTVLARENRPVTFEDALASTTRPVATDGDGLRR